MDSINVYHNQINTAMYLCMHVGYIKCVFLSGEMCGFDLQAFLCVLGALCFLVNQEVPVVINRKKPKTI